MLPGAGYYSKRSAEPGYVYYSHHGLNGYGQHLYGHNHGHGHGHAHSPGHGHGHGHGDGHEAAYEHGHGNYGHY